jgi:hypothetical protein
MSICDQIQPLGELHFGNNGFAGSRLQKTVSHSDRPTLVASGLAAATD